MQSCSAAHSGLNRQSLAPLKRVFRHTLFGQGCLFLDRDGVINERRDGAYVVDWSDFAFRPLVIQALQSASKFLPLVVVSNQRCIARGLASAVKVSSLMDRMCSELKDNGVLISAWYVCPHDEIDNCLCRKPNPGMLLQAARDLNIVLASSFMVGDSATDVAAGRAAGCNDAMLCNPADPHAFVRTVDSIIGEIYAG